MIWRRILEARRRLVDQRDERGSLALVMIIMMVGLAASSVLIPTMITQDRTTVYNKTNMQSLSAARAGIDVIIGQLRAAVTNGAGDPSKLPCVGSTAPETGTVDAAGRGSYSAYVSYYVVDPVKHPAATPMICVAGAGTYDTATGSFVPLYAEITSTGTDGVDPSGDTGGSLGRTLVSTYVFQTTNSNVLGGQVRIYPPGTSSTTSAMCWDAGSTAPVEGTVVTLQPCSASSPVVAQQQFSYRSDLTLQLDTSITSAYSNGLCLDTSTTSGGPVIGNTAYLAACAALGSPPYSQQWSFNDSGEYEASLSSSASDGGLSHICITVTDQSAGRQLTLDHCNDDGQGITSPAQAWIPSPSVGDGASAPPQLVNFQQFGRCLDITNQDVTKDHLIAYPCKQNPYPPAVTWNQKFTYSVNTGWLSTRTGGVQYCLYSPRTENGLVRATQCDNPAWVPGVTAIQLVWNSLGSAASLPYAQQSTFVDSSTTATRCLSIVPPPASDGSPWDYIDVATCDGSTAQKWNANPTLGRTLVQNTVEK